MDAATSQPVESMVSSNASFPAKLYILIETEGGDIIQWLPHGMAFRVIDTNRFCDEIVPRYFKHTKLTSFQRQLNLYGFRRVNKGEDQGAYSHPKFQRGRKDCLAEIKRVTGKGYSNEALLNVESVPSSSSGQLQLVQPPRDPKLSGAKKPTQTLKQRPSVQLGVETTVESSMSSKKIRSNEHSNRSQQPIFERVTSSDWMNSDSNTSTQVQQPDSAMYANMVSSFYAEPEQPGISKKMSKLTMNIGYKIQGQHSGDRYPQNRAAPLTNQGIGSDYRESEYRREQYAHYIPQPRYDYTPFHDQHLQQRNIPSNAGNYEYFSGVRDHDRFGRQMMNGAPTVSRMSAAVYQPRVSSILAEYPTMTKSQSFPDFDQFFQDSVLETIAIPATRVPDARLSVQQRYEGSHSVAPSLACGRDVSESYDGAKAGFRGQLANQGMQEVGDRVQSDRIQSRTTAQQSQGNRGSRVTNVVSSGSSASCPSSPSNSSADLTTFDAYNDEESKEFFRLLSADDSTSF